MPFVSNVEILPTIPTGKDRTAAEWFWGKKTCMSRGAGIATIRNFNDLLGYERKFFAGMGAF
jgi:hypothetical protein